MFQPYLVSAWFEQSARDGNTLTSRVLTTGKRRARRAPFSIWTWSLQNKKRKKAHSNNISETTVQDLNLNWTRENCDILLNWQRNVIKRTDIKTWSYYRSKATVKQKYINQKHTYSSYAVLKQQYMHPAQRRQSLKTYLSWCMKQKMVIYTHYWNLHI